MQGSMRAKVWLLDIEVYRTGVDGEMNNIERGIRKRERDFARVMLPGYPLQEGLKINLGGDNADGSKQTQPVMCCSSYQ